MVTNARYYLETFGCQMNVLDSQLVEGQLRARGLTRSDDWKDADLVLFNTCSVRQHAEDKVLSRLGQLKQHKRRRPEMVVGVIGCMAEREKEGLFAKAPHVDLLCGPGELDRLPALLDELRERQERVTALAGSLSRRTEVLQRALEADSLEALDLSRSLAPDESALQSYIRVQRGCDQFCTFCVVPFTRGAERSRPAAHIVAEARMLAERGCREVTLLGQTVNSYVHQEDGRPVRFARLLERVHAVEGIDRIRFVTSFPADWDADIFRVMRDYPKVCPYLHIPAQSGSDRILKAMRRGYTTTEYLKLMDEARRFLPEISLAGDVIVGFCGETDEDYRATCDLVRRVEYKSLFVFKYSPRPGTKADRSLEDDVSSEVKAARNNELLAIQAEISARHKQAFVGRTVEVLVEGFSKYSKRALEGAGTPGGLPGGHMGDLPGGPADGLPSGVLQESEQSRGDHVRRAEGIGGHAGRRRGAAANGPAAAEIAQLVGRTTGDLICVFDGPAEIIGGLAELRVERVSPLTMFARFERLTSPARDRGQVAAEPICDGLADGADAAGGRPASTGRTLPVLARADTGRDGLCHGYDADRVR